MGWGVEGVEQQRACKNARGGEERASLDRQRGSGRIDGGENERMNKTREKKLDTDTAVGQRRGCRSQKDIVRKRERRKKSRQRDGEGDV